MSDLASAIMASIAELPRSTARCPPEHLADFLQGRPGQLQPALQDTLWLSRPLAALLTDRQIEECLRYATFVGCFAFPQADGGYLFWKPS